MKATFTIASIKSRKERTVSVGGISYDQAMDYMALVSKGVALDEFVRCMTCTEEVVK